MPFKKLSKFAGMKHGGKVKRYDDGGDVDTAGAPDTTASDTEILKSTRSNLSFKDAFREARNAGDKTFEWQGKKYSTELKPASSASGYAGYAPKRETGTAAYRTAEKMKDAASRGFADLRRKATTEAENPDRMQRILGTRMGQPRFKQGGNVESKKMMAKEVAFMKKKGAPKSMLKHEEAEMKGYARGGKIKEVMGPRTMAKDVEGGSKARHLAHGEHSEQKRGHTRGTVVKMASGGSVRAHGEHSIQKSGHTKGRMV